MLALLLAALSLAVALALAARVAALARRLEAIERQPIARRENALPPSSPLQGLRVALDIAQDCPHPVFAGHLREALLQEEALVDDDRPDLTVTGAVVSNGYADVYFRAELTATARGEVLLTLTEKPPHGDRPENLARELVLRLKGELAKRERQGALRELGQA